MGRIRESLRGWSALCVALVVYAALPHVHTAAGAHPESTGLAEPVLAPDPASPPDPDDRAVASPTGAARLPVLSADDAHDAHTHALSLDAHPCTLCREKLGRDAIAAPPILPVLVSAAPGRVAVRDPAPLPERLAYARPPARAPPIA